MGPDFCSNCKRTQHSLGILHVNLEPEALADFLQSNRLASQTQRVFQILLLAQLTSVPASIAQNSAQK